jgi:predicted DNA-binding protein
MQPTKIKTLNIRTSEEEYKAIKDFASIQGQSVSGFVLGLVHDCIEDKEDILACEDYVKSETAGKSATVPHEDFMKELGLRRLILFYGRPKPAGLFASSIYLSKEKSTIG